MDQTETAEPASGLPPCPTRLAGFALELVAPRSHAERWDPLFAQRAEAPEHRVLAGALGLCSPRIRQFVPYEGDVVAFGGKVLDVLLGAKEPARMRDILIAGRHALALCNREAVTGEEVTAAQGFTAPGPSGP